MGRSADGGSGAPGDMTRRRRAILVADIVGSVAMMEDDEAGVVALWGDFMAELGRAILPAHGGRLVKSLGDGVRAEFPGAAGAVACAFAMHHDLAKRGAQGRRVRVRIGIHVAEVYVESYDVLGDGVNVAARLADLGLGGETIVSAEARDQITSGLDAVVEDLGEQRLRNRQRAVRAFRAWPVSEPARAPRMSLARTHGRPSIAVVPFRVLASEPVDALLADGLAEETIASLSKVADFFVVSRLSSMAFRDRHPGVQRVGDALGVQYVLSGSLRLAGGRVVLLAELADAGSGQVLWGDRVDGDLLDMFAAQADLARSVVQRVAPFVRAHELRRARITNPDKLDAFGLTLRGIELMHSASRHEFAAAVPAFERAIERDPTSPAPYAWLAKWHVLRVAMGLSPDRPADGSEAVDLADRALQRDPGDALALSVDALVSAWMRHDLDLAAARLEQALASNPNEPLAWLFKGTTHAWRGEGEAAVTAVERALSLSPLDPLRYYFCSLTGTANMVAGRHARAIEVARQSLRENCMHTPSWRILAICHELDGDHGAAAQAVARLREYEPELTAREFLARYPGRDSPHAARLAAALHAAGLPA